MAVVDSLSMSKSGSHDHALPCSERMMDCKVAVPQSHRGGGQGVFETRLVTQCYSTSVAIISLWTLCTNFF